mgnify:CR=1 FL=1
MDNKAKLDRAYGVVLFGVTFIILGITWRMGITAGLIALGFTLLIVGLGTIINMGRDAGMRESERNLKEFKKKHGMQ